MFFVDAAGQVLIFGFVPESLGVLIFGIGLILLTVGLRRLMKRGAESAENERIIHTTE